jgi:hypothetical protein
LKLRRAGDTPYLQFENTTGATRFGFVQGSATSLVYRVDNPAGTHIFQVGTTTITTIATMAAAAVTLGAGVDLITTGELRGGVGRFGSTVGDQVQVVDINGGGDAALASIGFYPAATSITALGARGAYVGYAGAGFQVSAAADLTVASTAGDVLVAPSGLVRFMPAGVERFRVDGATFLFGKTASNLAAAGVELYGTGSAVIGSIRATTTTAGVMPLYLRHGGAADANAQPFAQFVRGSPGVVLSEILQKGTTGAGTGITITNAVLTAPSATGATIADAVATLAAVTPRVDGFAAADLADIDGAVHDGQVNPVAVVPWTVAAITQLAARVAALEEAAA